MVKALQHLLYSNLSSMRGLQILSYCKPSSILLTLWEYFQNGSIEVAICIMSHWISFYLDLSWKISQQDKPSFWFMNCCVYFTSTFTQNHSELISQGSKHYMKICPKSEKIKTEGGIQCHVSGLLLPCFFPEAPYPYPNFSAAVQNRFGGYRRKVPPGRWTLLDCTPKWNSYWNHLWMYIHLID